MPSPTSTTTHPTPPLLPGPSRLICVASDRHPRYSEADVIELKDGRLFLALGRKDGASDFAVGTLVGFFSSDRGVTWDDQPHVVCAPFDDVTDLMSVSLFRSPRGVHLLFLGRGPDPKRDTRVYQMISADECRTWSKPARVSSRPGYHIVNNARVIRTRTGRHLAPAAHVPGEIHQQYNQQKVYCLYSDDDGQTWHNGQDLILLAPPPSTPSQKSPPTTQESRPVPGPSSAPSAPTPSPLMEPGVAQCADGSIYMTLRTATGFLYEARSTDDGVTWTDLRSTGLVSPAAPSTVTRDPDSDDLWLFFCDRPGKSNWKQRSRQAVSISKDHGRTWADPRPIEDDPKHSYGYISVTPVTGGQVLLTYYDWQNDGQAGFHMTHLRQRTLPLAWFRGEVIPPVFRRDPAAGPVLRPDDGAADGKILSLNSGILPAPEKWRAWYSAGALSPRGETMQVRTAHSTDQGVTWHKDKVAFPAAEGDTASYYHASVHRVGKQLIAYVWRRAARQDSGLWRYVSEDDGDSFRADPDRPLIVSHNASNQLKELAGDGRISNDAFDIVFNPGDGTWEYYAAVVEPAPDPRAIIQHDNAAGLVRVIGRATSSDGIHFSMVEPVIRPDYEDGDPYDTQFYSMQVFRYRGFHLGLLQTFHVQSQSIQPEWAWSHNGDNWARTKCACLALGNEGAFDSRMILFGDLATGKGALSWHYSGYDWRHNAFRQGEVKSAVGRATLPLKDLDAWLATLPQP